MLALAALAVSVALGTAIDAWLGHELAHWYVFDSGWFLALIVLVGGSRTGVRRGPLSHES